MTTSPNVEPENGGTARRVVASYHNYGEAEQAVDYLSDNGFPVERTAIIGRGLELVEEVTGRLTVLSAGGRSAMAGAIVGALIGWLFGIFNWAAPLISGLLLAVYGAAFGIVIGVLVGLVGHALLGGRRDFRSQAAMQASSYDLLVEAEVADRAASMLQARTSPAPTHTTQ